MRYTVRIGHAKQECVAQTDRPYCGLLLAHCSLSENCGRRHCIVDRRHACQMDYYRPVFSKPRIVRSTVQRPVHTFFHEAAENGLIAGEERTPNPVDM